LKRAYNDANNAPAPTVDLFVRIIKASCIQGTETLRAPDEHKDCNLKFPAKPEIEIVARILDFLDALTPSPGERIVRDDLSSGERKRPKFTLESDTKGLTLKIEIPVLGVSKLEENMNNSKNAGASPIAKELMDIEMLDIPNSKDFILIKIPFQNI